MAYTFLLSDESLNSHGTRIITAGIRLDLFLKNPIMLWNHTLPWSDKKDQVLPIGRWENLRVEDGKLQADAVFDENDAFARSIRDKVDQKIINACSVRVDVITTTADETMLVQGQTRPTVLECVLKEASIVDIPSNGNTVRLRDGGTGKDLTLRDGEDNFLLPILKREQMELREVIAALALKDADEKTALAEIARLKGVEQEVLTLRGDKSELEGELKKYRDKETELAREAVTDLVSEAIRARKIVEADREDYETLAGKDFERTKKVLDGMPVVTELRADGQGQGTDPWETRMEEIRKKNNNN